MNKCHEKDCEEERNEHHHWCDTHYNSHMEKLKHIKEVLIEKRMKDPFYMQDTLLYLKCIDVLIPYQWDDDDDEEESKFYVDHHMHSILFDDYYDQSLSRTHLLIQKIKELHRECCAVENGLEALGYEIHEYHMYTNFLTKWIEESKVIEKNKLIKELDVIDDIKTIVQRLITNL